MKKWLGILAAYLLLAGAAAAGFLGADYGEQHDYQEYLPPGRAEAWLGTDFLGRDVLARTLHGARLAVAVGGLAAGVALALGTLLGGAAGWRRGWIDGAAVFLCGAVQAIPAILLILCIGFVMGQGFATVLWAVGLTSWVGVFRMVRAEILRLKEADYVRAAVASGASAARIWRRHLLPNLLPLLLAQYALCFVAAVQAEVVVSFLGVGMAEEPSWGRAMAQAPHDLQRGAWWPAAAAALAMSGLVLAVQRVADHLQDRLPAVRL